MRQTITQKIDDLDHTSEAVETFQFSYEGKHYELDLNADNAEQFRAALEPWVQAATPTRRASKRATSRATSRAASSPGRGSAANRNQTTARRTPQIRQWAQSVGMTVSDRGRIPQSVIDQYDAAHQTPSTTQPESAGSGSSGSSRSNGRKTATNKTTKTAAKKSNSQKTNGQKTAAKAAGKRAAAKQSS